MNVTVNGVEVDAYFRAARLIVEVDSWEFRSDRESFENDRERDAEALVAGDATVRITKRRVSNTPEREAERLRAILARR